ncbi:MAG: pyridoxal 5'-phosphate synthase [Halioglobus sp.]
MSDPIELFKSNWDKAKSLEDANANYCTLATVSEEGQVSTRTLVLREVTDDSFVIFVNNTSPKWQQLHYSEKLELLVFWPSMMQQYRIRGSIALVPKDEMRRHWSRKPYDSKIIDHYYTDYHPQSSQLDSRETLLNGIDKLKIAYSREDDVPFPENAEGIAIKADHIETWQGSVTDRIHERHLYTLGQGQWACSMLVP